MMEWRLKGSVELAGEKPIDVTFIYTAGGNQKPEEGSLEGWSLDLPVVLTLFEAIDQGKLAASDARTMFLDAMAEFTERSGCCLLCEEALPRYEQALTKYEQSLADFEREAQEVTPESHPYIINSNGTVHVWNCRMAPPLGPPHHPGATLQEYAHRQYWEYEAMPRLGWRATAEELAEWIEERRGPRGGAGHRRCKACWPSLPGAYESEASGVE